MRLSALLIADESGEVDPPEDGRASRQLLTILRNRTFGSSAGACCCCCAANGFEGGTLVPPWSCGPTVGCSAFAETATRANTKTAFEIHAFIERTPLVPTNCLPLPKTRR